MPASGERVTELTDGVLVDSVALSGCATALLTSGAARRKSSAIGCAFVVVVLPVDLFLSTFWDGGISTTASVTPRSRNGYRATSSAAGRSSIGRLTDGVP